MTPLYADTSSLVKFLVAEAESAALTRAIGAVLVTSSVLASVELRAVVRRRGIPDGESLATEILRSLRLLPLSDEVFRSAHELPSRPPLKALDALHLATLRGLGPRATLVAYDRELCDAARAEGFTVISPG